MATTAPTDGSDKAITKTISLPASLWDKLDAHAKVTDGDRSSCIRRLVLSELGDGHSANPLAALALHHARHFVAPLSAAFRGPLADRDQVEVAEWLLHALIGYVEAGLPLAFPLALVPQEFSLTPFLPAERFAAIAKSNDLGAVTPEELDYFRREQARRAIVDGVHQLRILESIHLVDEATRAHLAAVARAYAERMDPGSTDVAFVAEDGAPPPLVTAEAPPRRVGHIRLRRSTPSPATLPPSQKTAEG